MPSQNLPKPNPPQVNKVFSAADDRSASVSVAAPVSPSTSSFTSSTNSLVKPLPSIQARPQVIPSGLAQENPGGTPPNMMVSATQPMIPSLDKQASVIAKPLIINTPSFDPQSPALDSDLQHDQYPTGKPISSVSSVSRPSVVSVSKPADQIPNQVQLASRPTGPTGVRPAAPITTASAHNMSDGKAEIAAAPIAASAAASVSKTPQPAAKKKFSLPIIIAAVVLALFVIGGAAFAILGGKSSKIVTTKSSEAVQPSAPPSTTVTYWGLWEDSQILKDVIADFEKKNPTIKVDYRKQSHRDYRERLQQANASSNGPDVFRYHVTWLPMLTRDLATMPSSVMTANEYKQTFYPTAFNNLQVGGQIVGIPLMYDGLALLYNKEMLKTANLEVPKTWAELRTAANKLTTPANPSERQTGSLTRAGLAIGNAGNVDHFSDILGLLIVQNGGNPAQANTQFVKDALTFYTNFFKQDKVWSERMANSTTAFAKGDVAMIFAPSWRIHDIQALNPNLDFGVASVPQLDSEKPVSWATFWAEGVSSKSKNKDAAWLFLKYLSSPEVLRKFYNDASQYRGFGEIYPRVDMAADLKDEPLVAAYLADAPIAKSWYLSSFTHDNGLNDQIIKYYEDAVNATLSSASMDKVVDTLDKGLKTVLSKYPF